MYKYIANTDSGIDMTSSDSPSFDDVIEREEEATEAEHDEVGAGVEKEEGARMMSAGSSFDEKPDADNFASNSKQTVRKRVSE